MPTLQDIRRQYPQYNDLSDSDLADSLHQKFYSDMPRDEFNKKIGIESAPETETTYTGEIAKGLARGPVDLLGMLGQGVYETFTGEGLRRAGRNLIGSFQGKEFEAPPDYTGKVEEKLGILPSSKATTGQAVAGTVAETLTNPMSWLGPESLGIKTLSAIGAGTGSELLGEAAESIDPELGPVGRLIGGAAGGTAPGSSAKERVRQTTTAKLKDEHELQAKADEGYAWLRDPKNVVQLTPSGIQRLYAHVVGDLYNMDADSITAPDTFRLVDKLRPGNKAIGNSKDILALHNKFSSVNPNAPADVRAAQVARGALRDWMEAEMPAGTATRLKKSMGDWSHYQMIDDVRTAMRNAIQRAESSGTNKNAINTMRQEIRQILKNDRRVAGFPQEAKDGMESIISGTILENLSRSVGKAVPYSSGFALVSALAHSDWAGPLAGLAVTSFGARKLGDFLTRRQIERLVQILQEQAPSNKWRAQQNRRAMRPVAAYPQAGALRGGLTGSEQPTQRQAGGGQQLAGDLGNFASGGLYGVAKGRGGGSPTGDEIARAVNNPTLNVALGVWTGPELKLLREAAKAGKSWAEIKALFPDKDPRAVQMQGYRLGLGPRRAPVPGGRSDPNRAGPPPPAGWSQRILNNIGKSPAEILDNPEGQPEL